VNSSITPAFWANFLWFGAFWVGMGVDLITGKMWKYDEMAVIPLSESKCEKQKKSV
jgi:hypothetical protein